MKTCSYADTAPPVVKENYDDDDDEVPNPAFYSGGASPWCGVWW